MATKFTIDLATLNIAWQPNTTYRIKIDEGIVKEIGNNRSISPEQIIDYTTPGVPTIASTVPSNNTQLSESSFKITFVDPVTKNTGNIQIKDASNNATLFTISMSNVSLIQNNTTLIFGVPDALRSIGWTNNTSDSNLKILKNYYILSDVGIVSESFFNNQFGITSNQTFKFSTGPSLYLKAFEDTVGDTITDISCNNGAVVIGCGNKDLSSTSRSGEVYVYTGEDFTVKQTLSNPSNNTSGQKNKFGDKVTIMDTQQVIVISAPGEMKLYIYTYVSTEFILSTTLSIPLIAGISAHNHTLSVAIDQTITAGVTNRYIVVGAVASTTNAGVVYRYKWSEGNTWVLDATLQNPNFSNDRTGSADRFGHCVDIKGNFMAVSAPEETDFAPSQSGAVYLYYLPGTTPVATFAGGFVYATNEGFGTSISLTNQVLFISSRQSGAGESGYVRGIKLNGSQTLFTDYGVTNNENYGAIVKAVPNQYNTSTNPTFDYFTTRLLNGTTPTVSSSQRQYSFPGSSSSTYVDSFAGSNVDVADQGFRVVTSLGDKFTVYLRKLFL